MPHLCVNSAPRLGSINRYSGKGKPITLTSVADYFTVEKYTRKYKVKDFKDAYFLEKSLSCFD